MRRILTSIVLAVAALAPLLGILTSAPAAQAATGTPQTVPALRAWTAGTGSFAFGTTSRVVVDPAYAAQLTGDANTFAADLTALAGRTVSVIQGTPAAGDIALTLGATSLPAEGYTMTVGPSITIKGASTAGEFWGTRTVLQLLRQSPTVPAGTAQDWPTKPERGLMVNSVLKHFPVEWLENQIRDMSYLKQNYLHLEFRLQSSTHPEINSPEHYTKQDIARLVALGNAYHVTIVPEINMPGHMDQVLAAHPELKLHLPDGSTPNPSDIDLSNPAAYTLMKDLIDEFLPLFTSSAYWHVGADEYRADFAAYPQLLRYARARYGANATAKDVYYGFVNWADSIVRAHGKTMRMWNDGIHSGDGTVTPNSDIIVEYWINSGLTPQEHVNAGRTVANASWTPTYYIFGGAKPDTPWMYESWNPDLFESHHTIDNKAKNRGSLIHIWTDNPNAESIDQTAAGIKYPMRALAQMTWGSPKLAPTYAAFVPIMDAIGRNPKWSAAEPTTGDMAYDKLTTASSVQSSTGFTGDTATDGDPGTRWSSAFSDPQWLQVDLGSVQTVDRVVLAWEAAYAKAYQIQMSTDGTTWTTLYSTTTGAGGTETLTGFTGTGRYIRMNGTQRATQYGYSLWSFQVFHDAEAAGTTIVGVASGRCVDVPGARSEDGNDLNLYGCNNTVAQKWTFSAAGGEVRALGKCMDVEAARHDDGTPVQLYKCNNTAAQKWTYDPQSRELKAFGKCLDAYGGGSADGTKLILYSCHGRDNQKWRLIA